MRVPTALWVLRLRFYVQLDISATRPCHRRFAVLGIIAQQALSSQPSARREACVLQARQHPLRVLQVGSVPLECLPWCSAQHPLFQIRHPR